MSTITLFKGTRGKGKTLGQTYLGLRHYLIGRRCDRCGDSFDFIAFRGQCPFCMSKKFHKYDVYANYKLGFPYKPLHDLEQLQEIEDAVVLIDEVYKWANAREATKKRNRFVNTVLSESRHRQIDILLTSQNEKQVDLWIRRETDQIGVPFLNKQSGTCTLLMFAYYNNEYFMNMEHFIRSYNFDIKPIFNLYNSWEILKKMKLKSEVRKEELEELRELKQIDKLKDEVIKL